MKDSAPCGYDDHNRRSRAAARDHFPHRGRRRRPWARGAGDDHGARRRAEPHSGSNFEIAGSLGFALTVIGTLPFAANRLRPLLFPLIAVGALPLTVYSAHVIAVWLLGNAVTGATGNLLLAVFLAMTVAASTV